MSLLKQFDDLMSHLNGEENGLAAEFRKALTDTLHNAERDSLWRRCLESGGVDNWSWYSESLSDYWDWEEEHEDE
jgi:hypothetical protein